MNARLRQFLKDHELSERVADLQLENGAIDSEHIELAAQDGRIDMMLWLLKHNAPLKKLSEQILERHPLTGAVLAACGEKKNEAPSDPVVTYAVYIYALRAKTVEMQERVKPNLPDFKLPEQEFKLAGGLNKAYQFASRGHAKNVARACSNDMALYSQLFQHAFLFKNTVALQTMIEVCKNREQELVCELLRNQQGDCMKFFVIASGMDLYRIVLKLQKDKKLLEQFVAMMWTENGMLSGLIARCVLAAPPAADVIVLVKKHLHRRDTLITMFEHAFQERYKPDSRVKVDFILNRLNIIVPKGSDLPFPWPDQIYNIVIGYCGKKERAELRNWTRYLGFLVDSYGLPSESLNQQRLDYLQHQCLVLDKFIKSATADLKSKNCCSDAGQLFNRNNSIALSIMSLMLLVGIVLIVVGSRKYRSLEGILGRSTYGSQKTPCLYPVVGKASEFDCAAECDGCGDYKLWAGIFSFAMWIAISLGLFGSGRLAFIFCNQDRRRFEDLPLHSFKEHTKRASEEMLLEFKGTLFGNHSLESKAGEVLTIARMAHGVKLEEMKSLKPKALPARSAEQPEEPEEDRNSENQKWYLTLLPPPPPENKNEDSPAAPLLKKILLPNTRS